MSLGEPPLRVLVIGDSLAAGVGMKDSSVPMLPQAIAHTLSVALQGRPVYWTCVGTPGLSSTEVIEEIHNLDDLPTPLIRQLKEWESEKVERAQVRLEAAKMRAKKLWEEHNEPVDIDEKDAPNPLARWWKVYRYRVARDFQNLRRVVNQDEHDLERTHLQLEGRVTRMVRRNSLDPDFVNQYDVAVVLTGMNDLKDSFLPFMMPEKRMKMLKEYEKENGVDGMKARLNQIVEALKGSMKIRLPGDSNQEDDEEEKKKKKKGNVQRSDTKQRRGPLVVFPALPIAPISMSQVSPLNWFLVPIIHGMDRNKRFLAEMYPEFVLFVESPDIRYFSDAEKNSHTSRSDGQAENIMLKLHDIAKQAMDKVESLMDDHYKDWVVDTDDRDDNFLYEIYIDEIIPLSQKPMKAYPGATLVSPDGLHPNDQGCKSTTCVLNLRMCDCIPTLRLIALPHVVRT